MTEWQFFGFGLAMTVTPGIALGFVVGWKPPQLSISIGPCMWNLHVCIPKNCFYDLHTK